jgi:hypothetical protein
MLGHVFVVVAGQVGVGRWPKPQPGRVLLGLPVERRYDDWRSGSTSHQIANCLVALAASERAHLAPAFRLLLDGYQLTPLAAGRA